MSSLEDDDATEQISTPVKPTMLDLWRRLPEALQTPMMEAPGLPYIRVTYAFAGIPVTRAEFEAVLRAYNRLAGTHFTREDIAGTAIEQEGENTRES